MSDKNSNKKIAKSPIPIELDLSMLKIADSKVNFHTTTTVRTRDIIASIAELHGKNSYGAVLDEISDVIFKSATGVSFNEWVRMGRPGIIKDEHGKVTFKQRK